ncbi:MAG TPA: bifunctional 5,10-methylenetetrahydrofolate dehydrogenase/5,10-methenyltetrahydrofolate cyclohydrolase [Patescibacteria group bacterium]|nr:bifunctional 5,10-methylenetetrahydrofolate dehydrogenase/5,10-methenyltetrahydrofolate cyclohydrolase [Patescibacteria group bacterium]
MAIIFDGKAFAKRKEDELKNHLQNLHLPHHPKVWALCFTEDEGSLLYTKLKKAAAQRIGIVYEPTYHSLTEDLSALKKMVSSASKDPSVSGVMIQKPAKALMPSGDWWSELVSHIDPAKDVDGLTLKIQNPKSKIQFLPATVRAVLSILEEAKKELKISDDEWRNKRVLIIGRSDIVGAPLQKVTSNKFKVSKNVGKENFDAREFDIVISATGKANLVTGDMIKKGAIVIDVGAPQGDIERASVEPKAAFLTPVPGGVGPVTVVSLMENVVSVL